LKRENQILRNLSGDSTDMVGSSAVMKQLMQSLKRAAPSNGRVMLSGPMGSGKELAARALHAWSTRADAPFVVLPAATMLPESLEEELFGVEDSSGRAVRTGKLEEAHTGTLYLDEVADMPMETQSKVLPGAGRPDVYTCRGCQAGQGGCPHRVVDGEGPGNALIKAEAFREDLLHRLAVVPIRLPALHERREDIPELVQHFCALYSTQTGHPARAFAN
jgi:two-component system nitrogen regulation response regulator NtrX